MIKQYLDDFAASILTICAVFVAYLFLLDTLNQYKFILVNAPYVLLFIVAAVSGFMLQYDTFYKSTLLFAVYFSIRGTLQTSLIHDNTYTAFTLLSLYWPLVIILLQITGAKSLGTWMGKLNVVAIAALFSLPYLSNYPPLVNVVIGLPAGFHRYVSEGPLAFGFLTTYLPTLVLVSILYYLQPSVQAAAWILTVIVALLMSAFFSEPFISSVTFIALGFMLLQGIIREAFVLAYIDELTGIPARKALQNKLNNLGRKYVLAMLDIDHFKKFNDTYGHDVGDQVLALVASKINQVGGGGKAFRYGGEEFTIVFAGKTVEEAKPYLEIVRESVANYEMQLRSDDRPKDDEEGQKQRTSKKSKPVKVAISIGFSERSEENKLPEQVLKEADNALYDAKEAGRNCVKSR